MVVREVAPPLRRAIPARSGEVRSGEVRSPRRREPADAVATLLLALLLCLPLMPLERIFAGETWRLQSVITVVVLLGIGWAVRALRGAGVLALVVQILVAVGAATLLTAPSLALLFIIPTSPVFGQWDLLAGQAVQLIREGVAPMPEDPALTFLLVSAIAAVTILTDLAVTTLRMTTAAVLVPLALALVPSGILPNGSDGVAIALIVLVGAALFYRRVRLRGSRRPRGVLGAGITAVGATLVLAMMVTPLLPRAGDGSLQGFGLGGASRINATLDLGEDLRRPNNTRMLTFTTDGGPVPYLRLTTLSAFTGDVWTPDEGERVVLDWLTQSPEPRAPEVAIKTQKISVNVDGVDSTMLPLPAEPFDITGLGADWGANADNRTVSSNGALINGLHYGASYTSAQPSEEQIRATSAQAGARTGIAEGDAPLLHQFATEVTANAETDYDKLLALQSWFRSGEFTYSLDAPVQEGYDGSSVAAIEAFLAQRSGYCIHFAAAFTLMARDLGMQARIALGFLPGDATGARVDDRAEYAVTSDQLHTWPEVYFAGIGWVAFEPTASLGVPTRFLSSTAPGTDPTAPAEPVPTTTAGAQPERPDIENPTGTDAGSSGPQIDLGLYLGILGWVVLAVAAALVPLAIRTVLRSRRLSAARRGDAAAAWEELRADAIDHGLRAEASDTPRDFVDRVAKATRASRSELDLLRRAIEQTSYARAAVTAGDGTSADGAALTAAVSAVHHSWEAGVDVHARRRARFLPASLLPRRSPPPA